MELSFEPHYEEYDVMATFDDGSEQSVGEIILPVIRSNQDMPTELEINGVVYYPQF